MDGTLNSCNISTKILWSDGYLFVSHLLDLLPVFEEAFLGCDTAAWGIFCFSVPALWNVRAARSWRIFSWLKLNSAANLQKQIFKPKFSLAWSQMGMQPVDILLLWHIMLLQQSTLHSLVQLMRANKASTISSQRYHMSVLTYLTVPIRILWHSVLTEFTLRASICYKPLTRIIPKFQAVSHKLRFRPRTADLGVANIHRDSKLSFQTMVVWRCTQIYYIWSWHDSTPSKIDRRSCCNGCRQMVRFGCSTN